MLKGAKRIARSVTPIRGRRNEGFEPELKAKYEDYEDEEKEGRMVGGSSEEKLDDEETHREEEIVQRELNRRYCAVLCCTVQIDLPGL